jgi:hypothetical protein
VYRFGIVNVAVTNGQVVKTKYRLLAQTLLAEVLIGIGKELIVKTKEIKWINYF